jgi:MFS transporter, DHA1 family, inner membrane transport protein
LNAGGGATLVRAQRALLAGNFAIGCGVMVVAGSLNDLVRSLAVPVAVGGQLITAAAFVMALGAPLLAALLGRWDRRRLLACALAWYALGHAACALMPDFALLLPVRAACVLGAAVFTPQAAAAIGVLAPPEQRGRAITHIFLGWSLASVVGMPLASYLAETLGWRAAFFGVALLAAATGWAVWRALPDRIHPPPMSLASWGRALSHPVLMGMVAITALSGAGQFTLFSYLAPYYRQVLQASPAAVSFLFLWFGMFGLLGNLLLTRWIDRVGAGPGATGAMALMALSLLLWPLGGGVAAMALVLTPWALGCFSSNSAQQARLAAAEPAYAPALLALNTSAIYVGQGLGAGSGGLLLAAAGFGVLHWAGLAWLALAVGLSAWLLRRVPAAGRV